MNERITSQNLEGPWTQVGRSMEGGIRRILGLKWVGIIMVLGLLHGGGVERALEFIGGKGLGGTHK